MKFNWKKKQKEPIKPLTEKEIQQQLYGFIESTRKDKNENQFIIKEIEEKFEKEKAELVNQAAREKERTTKEKEDLKEVSTKEKEGLLKIIKQKKRTIEGKEQDLASLKARLKQNKQELSTVLSLKQQNNISPDNISFKSPFRISAIKTIFDLSPKLVILSLVILIICFVSFKIIYSRTSSPGTASLPAGSPRGEAAGSRGRAKQIAGKIPPKTAKKPVNKYAVQICVYEKESEARQLVNNLKRRNYPAYFTTRVSPKGKTYYNIYIGKFRTERDASSFLDKIRNKKELEEFKDSFVKKL